MPLIVEDGTMPIGANSYTSLADADAYLVPRGLWAATPTVVDAGTGVVTPDGATITKKETALIRATDYLNTLDWKGEKVAWERLFAWPRVGISFSDLGNTIVPSVVVPAAVKISCIELAAACFAGDNPLAAVARDDRLASKTIGVISKSWFDGVPDETLYPAVAGLVAPFLRTVPGKKSALTGVVEAGRG